LTTPTNKAALWEARDEATRGATGGRYVVREQRTISSDSGTYRFESGLVQPHPIT